MDTTVKEARYEVLRHLDGFVDAHMAEHQDRRRLWYPSELMSPPVGEDPEQWRLALRARAANIPDALRVSLAVHLITEEGLPLFAAVWGSKVPMESATGRWLSLWVAEEDRHGTVMRDYCRDAGILNMVEIDTQQFEYLRRGYEVIDANNPYQNVCYAAVQERFTQLTHKRTGRQLAKHEPLITSILDLISAEEARHFAFYSKLFAEIIAADPEPALTTAASVLGGIAFPGHSMPHFAEYADVVGRLGIFGLTDFLETAEMLIKLWKIESLTGLSSKGEQAREQILKVPLQLRRTGRILSRRQVNERTFNLGVVYDRELVMNRELDEAPPLELEVIPNGQSQGAGLLS